MHQLCELLSQKQPKVGHTTFIGIDGHGGSGKSTLARLLSENLGAEIVQTDDFASWENPLDWSSALIQHVFLPIRMVPGIERDRQTKKSNGELSELWIRWIS